MNVLEKLENLTIALRNEKEAVTTVFNWSYWRSSAVIVHHYRNNAYEVYEIYTKDALKLRISIDHEANEITWEISSLSKSYCSG